ncbi:FCD domain-containing protein [Sphaerisporangium sp. NPDC004334]
MCARGQAAVEAGDIDGAMAANSELHATITEMSGNAVLGDLAGQVSRRVRWHHTPVARRRGRASWQEPAQPPPSRRRRRRAPASFGS